MKRIESWQPQEVDRLAGTPPGGSVHQQTRAQPIVGGSGPRHSDRDADNHGPAGDSGDGGTPGNRPAAPDERADAWQAWLQTPPGRYVLKWEQAQLDQAVADLFGLHALQCGGPLPDALRANRMPHPIRAWQGTAMPDEPRGSLVQIAHFEELPFDTRSLDLVVLPHVLEFAHDPHQVLREVDRVLRPEGRLIVTGFNPVSLWGLREAVPRALVRPLLPPQAHPIVLHRLRDWCKLLSFEIDSTHYGCFRLPLGSGAWLDRMGFMERAGDRWWPLCGAVYLVSAVKRVQAMRLVGRARKRAVRGTVVALPSAHYEPSERRGPPQSGRDGSYR
jgi:SAM-dependent methyltransferase